MGSGTSTQLKCPSDYDTENFNKILRLYDKLDKDGDHVVETEELKEISDLHIKNRINLLDLKEKQVFQLCSGDKNKETL